MYRVKRDLPIVLFTHATNRTTAIFYDHLIFIASHLSVVQLATIERKSHEESVNQGRKPTKQHGVIEKEQWRVLTT
jgi:hypothetical protein